ncbi:hypothetical protein [Neobacillus rhizophilus]|uniref:Uncharacterized protein n=1 Tax=Neobacillus rhizophilus TaxID=2833579 RepID=A0A942U3H5_9BACI|nr:hypothetical protein [Neobacillus rhizophilus]MBS4213996.1 hypothetical protein [Neobacillus rhizophilus]
MNSFLLNWAIFIFMAGLILSLPLGAVFYLKNSQLNDFFTNPRKLKAAHLDYIMQSFSIGLVLLLEFTMNIELPIYMVIPLAFGTFCNPFIFLLEATPLYKAEVSKIIYRILKVISPASLFFAWIAIMITSLPAYISWLLLFFTLMLGLGIITNKKKLALITKGTQLKK